LFIELKSEFVLFFGSEGESKFFHVLNEVVLKGREFMVVWMASSVMVSSECSGFANELHYK
jgi:hypothetical protein